MARYAFRLRLRPDRIADYDRAHRKVWPDLLRVIKEAGVSNYSIFRLDTELFFYLQAQDFEVAWAQISSSKIDALWQREMAPLFDPSEGSTDSGSLVLMAEVFHLD